ncbi:MAG TPA: N,N-dimethylformamidase beta subunit family domain-containing protein [Bryobacteraceae bacterium]|nr:N,N-dimethylformamidase beta subunit family domain-containing protein [Bryobacteraceae bacterium]
MRRRELLQAAATLPLPRLIAQENRRAGDPSWQLSKVWPNMAKGHRSALVEGYCGKQSVYAGETLPIYVSTKPARRFTLDIFRMGYYGGAGARHMLRLGPFAGRTQEDPPTGPNRLRECKWEPAETLRIPAGWPSGVYFGKLTTIPESGSEHGWQSYVIFIVKDRRKADVLFQCSDNTWAAYNQWPDSHSFYTDPRHSWAPSVAVSFDRPYAKYPQIFDHPLSVGSGEFLLWEFPLAYWLESQGYDVTYTSNSDMLTPEAFTRAKVFLSVGHDEYWDQRQYDAAMASVRQGVTHLYLSGNAVMGLAPFQPASDGRPNRIISREGVYGGAYGGLDKFFRYPFPQEGPKANLLMGAHSVYPFNGGGDWICTKPDHWVFSGTNMKAGDRIEGLIGWEFHGDPAPIPGLEIVAEGDALSGGRIPSHWTSTIYPGPKGNFVFNAATIWWAQGLSSPPGHILPWSHWCRPLGTDPRVQRITANLLAKALAR